MSNSCGYITLKAQSSSTIYIFEIPSILLPIVAIITTSLHSLKHIAAYALQEILLLDLHQGHGGGSRRNAQTVCNKLAMTLIMKVCVLSHNNSVLLLHIGKKFSQKLENALCKIFKSPRKR